MRSYRYYLLFLTLAIFAGFAGLRWFRRDRSEPPSGEQADFSALRNAPVDPEAADLLDRAVAAVQPDRLLWLETELWQRVTFPGLTYEAEGKLLQAPEDRFRLELTTSASRGDLRARPSTQVVVSDGINVWHAHRGAGDEWVEDVPDKEKQKEKEKAKGKAISLEKKDNTSTDPDVLPGKGGIAPLLGQLQSKLNWVRCERLPNGRTCLTGVTEGGKPQRSRLGSLRACRVVLDKALWPARIEWWGPGKDPALDYLFIEMEFRKPVLNQPFPLARSVQEFTLRPSTTVVTVPTVPGDPLLSIPAPPAKR